MSYKHSFILRNQLKINIKIVLDIINRAYFSRRERGVGKGLILIESPFFQIQICLGFGTLSPQKGGCGGSILNFSGLKKTSSKWSNDDGKFYNYYSLCYVQSYLKIIFLLVLKHVMDNFKTIWLKMFQNHFSTSNKLVQNGFTSCTKKSSRQNKYFKNDLRSKLFQNDFSPEVDF